MNHVKVCLAISAIVLVLACAFQSAEAKGSKFNWRGTEQVKDFLKERPWAQRMTDGPIGGILDLIIDIILILFDIILGGALAPLQTQVAEMKEQMDQMGALLGGTR